MRRALVWAYAASSSGSPQLDCYATGARPGANTPCRRSDSARDGAYPRDAIAQGGVGRAARQPGFAHGGPWRGPAPGIRPMGPSVGLNRIGRVA